MPISLLVMRMREGVGKLTVGDKSKTGILYIPADLMVDSAFPFKAPVRVKIRIENERLIIEKAKG